MVEILGCAEGAKACRCEGRMRGVGNDIVRWMDWVLLGWFYLAPGCVKVMLRRMRCGVLYYDVGCEP